ncbi:MAG: ImmA/IrrE family metallo-endopeptidase [Micromonosporaceae bacterium]|nr:ImmA/IrrE family metallo-endopeptidase [Micromonosporaceae bacterium]
MKAAQIRHRCLRRLADLGDQVEIPRPFDATELSRQVSSLLGHDIALVALPMATGAPYGVTLFTDDAHVIAYERHTSRVHQDHIIAHELGHVLLGHLGVEIDTDQAASQLFPALKPALVRRILRRTGVYTKAEEFEAETMATLLLELGNQRSRVPGDQTAPQHAEAAARLRDALEDRIW